MRAILFFIFILLLGQVAGAQTNAQTVITIELNESGNASWIGEKRYIITTSEIKEWEARIKQGQNITKYQKEVNEDLDKLRVSAQMSTNRSMRIEDLNISFDTVRTASGGFGIIRYSFLWENFSYSKSGKIIVGDAFSEGGILTSTLVIKIPEGYDVQSVSPAPDKRDRDRLVWESATFDKGKPSLELSRPIITWPVMVIVLVILISGSSYMLWKKGLLPTLGKKAAEVITSAGESGTSKSVPIEGEIVQSDLVQKENTGAIVAQKVNTGIEASFTPPPIMPDEFLGDEEMIERYLIKCGGQAFQSDIVSESGLSKSKISIVLGKMKDEGRVIKIKKGKENIIRLAPKK